MMRRILKLVAFGEAGRIFNKLLLKQFANQCKIASDFNDY